MRLVKYRNGNYFVTIDLDTGTKVRSNDLDFFEPEYPDLKHTRRLHGTGFLLRWAQGSVICLQKCSGNASAISA